MRRLLLALGLLAACSTQAQNFGDAPAIPGQWLCTINTGVTSLRSCEETDAALFGVLLAHEFYNGKPCYTSPSIQSVGGRRWETSNYSGSSAAWGYVIDGTAIGGNPLPASVYAQDEGYPPCFFGAMPANIYAMSVNGINPTQGGGGSSIAAIAETNDLSCPLTSTNPTSTGLLFQCNCGAEEGWNGPMIGDEIATTPGGPFKCEVPVLVQNGVLVEFPVSCPNGTCSDTHAFFKATTSNPNIGIGGFVNQNLTNNMNAFVPSIDSSFVTQGCCQIVQAVKMRSIARCTRGCQLVGIQVYGVGPNATTWAVPGAFYQLHLVGTGRSATASYAVTVQ